MKEYCLHVKSSVCHLAGYRLRDSDLMYGACGDRGLQLQQQHQRQRWTITLEDPHLSPRPARSWP